MERELRALYLRWLRGLSYESSNVMDKVDFFERQSTELIERMGGRTAMLGALADFPAPKRLDLSPHVGTIYSDMKQAAIQAGMIAGMQSTDVARAMFNAGMDKSFNRLNRLARTETVSAYWKNAWGSISDLPALVMVWGSEDGPRTCAWCRERDGMVMDSSDLRDHPNGRCTPIPTLRSQVEYRGSVSRDGSMYFDADWNKATRVPQQQAPLRTETPAAKRASILPETSVLGNVKPMNSPAAGPAPKYSVSLKTVDGTSVYTEKDFDQPSKLPAGNTIREALQYAVDHSKGFSIPADGDFEFYPSKVAKIILWDGNSPEEITLAYALEILRGGRK